MNSAIGGIGHDRTLIFSQRVKIAPILTLHSPALIQTSGIDTNNYSAELKKGCS